MSFNNSTDVHPDNVLSNVQYSVLLYVHPETESMLQRRGRKHKRNIPSALISVIPARSSRFLEAWQRHMSRAFDVRLFSVTWLYLRHLCSPWVHFNSFWTPWKHCKILSLVNTQKREKTNTKHIIMEKKQQKKRDVPPSMTQQILGEGNCGQHMNRTVS